MRIKRNNKITRCAILIGNDHWGGNYLPGVSHDIEGIRNYLLSPEGGAWESNEIKEITNSIEKDAFISFLESVAQQCEYVFLFFGGHGELSRCGDPLFVLPGGEEVTLSQIKEPLKVLPVLMISDSCQGVPSYSQGGQINEALFSQDDNNKALEARKKFDDVIRQMPPMFTYASAVSQGQTADENDSGGLYTQELLKSCENIIKGIDKPDVYGICYPHELAKLAVTSLTCNKQRPKICGYNRTNQPPFIVKLT